jgi:hypothetical protein
MKHHFLKAALFSLLTHLLTMSCYAQAFEPVDLVWDLDWTLVSPVKQHFIDDKNGQYIQTSEGLFRVVDGVGQILQFFDQTGLFRQSFYTGASKERTDKILASIKLPDGRSAGELAFKVLGKEDLTPVENPPLDGRFADRFKKDLNKLSANQNLKRTILIDDIAKFYFLGQKENLLWLQETYNFLPSYKNEISDKFDPPHKAYWSLERNKLLWVVGVLMRAIELSPAGDIRQGVLKAQIKSHENTPNRYSDTALSFYRDGLKHLQNKNLTFQFVDLPLSVPPRCHSVF